MWSVNVKPLYKRPLDAILATWGLGIVIIQLIIMIFGRSVQMVDSPLEGTWHVLGADYSAYRLTMIPVAVVMFGVILIMLNGTLYGIKTRAVIMNEALAQGLGINSDLIRLLTFSIGAGLGTLAGMFITPLTEKPTIFGIVCPLNFGTDSPSNFGKVSPLNFGTGLLNNSPVCSVLN